MTYVIFQFLLIAPGLRLIIGHHAPPVVEMGLKHQPDDLFNSLQMAESSARALQRKRKNAITGHVKVGNFFCLNEIIRMSFGFLNSISSYF